MVRWCEDDLILDCPHVPEIGADAFRDKLYSGPRHPYSVMIELTSRCNNRCGHCYVPASDLRGSTDALSTDWLLALMDVLVLVEPIR